MSADFFLDDRLRADSVAVVSLPLCDVRLMNDARFAWLMLIPRRSDMEEISDLGAGDQTMLWRECMLAGDALRATGPCDKLNLGALGNMVRQLHVHVLARCVGDAAWPGPVWGHGRAQAYEPAVLTERLTALRHAMRAPAA
ncbi:MAG: HIT family protein [Rhodanobacter sp.]